MYSTLRAANPGLPSPHFPPAPSPKFPAGESFSIQERYGKAIGASRQWLRKTLLFEDPLYYVNYLYAAVVAVVPLDRVHTDRDFASSCQALLRRGFDAEPEALLTSLHIRLDDPELVKQHHG